jgi:hypothetical protein
MTRRPRSSASRSGAPVASRTAVERPTTVHTSLYLPGPVYEALRKIAYDERVKIHDVVIDGIDAALRRRGYPSIDNLKGKKGECEPGRSCRTSRYREAPCPPHRARPRTSRRGGRHALRLAQRARATRAVVQLHLVAG